MEKGLGYESGTDNVNSRRDEVVLNGIQISETSLRRPGIEPRSTAWKAAMLATTPPTLPYNEIDNIASRDFQLLVDTQKM